MKIKILIILILTLLLTVTPSVTATVYGAEFVKGQSIVAEDQVKASNGLNFAGLNITWLDIGDSHIQSYSQMDIFSEGIFTLRLSDETICFDTTGKIIAAGDYNGIHEFSDGMAKVYKYIPRDEPDVPGRLIGPPGQMEGFIDNVGNEVIPLGMHSNMGDKFHEGFTTIGGYEENKGYINIIGEIVIPQIYKDAGNFSEGLAAVQSVDTELWGYIDKDGELVIPMIYEAAAPFSEEAAYVVKDGLAGYIDKDGNNIIDFKLKSETNKYVDNSFYEGLAVAQDSSGKYGYINKNGDFVIQAKYKEANPFIGEAAFVVREDQNYLNGYGSSFLMNRNGERLTPLWQYGRYSGEYMREGLIRALSTYGPSPNESIVMLNKYGAEVIPSSLNIQYLSSFNEGYAMLIAHNNDDTAVGLVKIPENIESYNDRKIIRVFIDDKLLDFEDTDPIIENSRTLVPMRAIFEALGAEVEWDDANKTALATKDDITISLKIDDNIGYINNEPVELDVPAIIKNSRTLVPLRFIAESFNAYVTWDDGERAVLINTSDIERLVFDDYQDINGLYNGDINISDCEILLINTYLKHILDASDDFYKEYFTISPAVTYDYVWVKEISVDGSTNPSSNITFTCMPFVGAHLSVGIDEITFSTDYVGDIELNDFKHIKSYSLPEYLKSLMIKPIPGEYDEAITSEGNIPQRNTIKICV